MSVVNEGSSNLLPNEGRRAPDSGAAEIAHVGGSSAPARREEPSGRTGVWLERRPRNLGALELDGLVARASDVILRRVKDLGHAPAERDLSVVADLCAMRDLIAAAERRLAVRDAEVVRLRERVRELETWLEESAQFDQIEHVQLGRVLALASAEREERKGSWLVSLRLVAAVVYVIAVGVFIWFVVVSHL
jgi:hypothetical protein